jgi:hypothetical protein
VPRGLVALFALIEALFVVAAGVLGALAVALLGWASLAGSAITPVDVWRIAVDLWALGHGVPLHISLTDATGAFAAPNNVFNLTLAPFGFAALTAVLGRRAGTRIAVAEDSPIVAGLFVAFVAALTALTLSSATVDAATFDVPMGTIRVTTIFVIGMLIGWKPWEASAARSRSRLELGPRWQPVLVDAGRIALGVALALVAAASLLIAIGVIAGFPTEIALYESLHAGVFGGFVVAVLQLALAPVLIVWAIAWIAGPGFALGVGSLVSPFTATVGAVPAIPILGAVPTSMNVGAWVCVVPVIIACVVTGRALRTSNSTIGQSGFGDDVIRAAATALGAALFFALGTAFIGSLASGSAGPGRFTYFGIDITLVSTSLGVEVFLGALVIALARVVALRSR